MALETISSVWSIDDQRVTISRQHDSVSDATRFYDDGSVFTEFTYEYNACEFEYVDVTMYDNMGHYIVNVIQMDPEAVTYL